MTPQDCPFLYEGDFAQSLLNDCRDYARHIAGKFRPRPATLTNHLSSALHLEMKLSKPKAELPNRYLPNDLEYNTWKAMANRTTHMPDDEKILKEAKDEIFHRIRNVLPSTENCEAHDFDRKILTLLSELRDQGLTYFPNWASKPPWRPPELGTIGLAQRLVNLYYEYELAWTLTLRPASAEQEHPSQDLYALFPHLHATLHVAFIKALEPLPLGRWLTKKEYMRTGKFLNNSDGKYHSWWQTDCLRTYYGIQILLRRAAMTTWLPHISQDDITAMAQNAKEMYKETFPSKRMYCLDWLELATDTSNEDLQNAIERTFKTLLSEETQPPPQTEFPTDRKTLYLSEYEANGQPHHHALRLTPTQGSHHELGAICYLHSELDLKEPQDCGYLIKAIEEAGGNSTSHPDFVYSEDGNSHCWGDTGFEGGIRFNSLENAVAYLKKYFPLQAAPDNTYYTQDWIDWV